MDNQNTQSGGQGVGGGGAALHVVVFPWLAMGHIIPFFHLSTLIAKRVTPSPSFPPQETSPDFPEYPSTSPPSSTSSPSLFPAFLTSQTTPNHRPTSPSTSSNYSKRPSTCYNPR
ncbi:hypothetical protein ACFX2B_043547 [Malus domestica]